MRTRRRRCLVVNLAGGPSPSVDALAAAIVIEDHRQWSGAPITRGCRMCVLVMDALISLERRIALPLIVAPTWDATERGTR